MSKARRALAAYAKSLKKEPVDSEELCRASVAKEKWDPDGELRQCKRRKAKGSHYCTQHTDNPPVWWKR